MKILISACLLGENVRYDGYHNRVESPCIDDWQKQGLLVPVCPEVKGGLPIPRPPAEIIGGEGSDVLERKADVVDINGKVVTESFLEGARDTLRTALECGAVMAVLKERSPSCGSACIYDGRFRKSEITGMGVTARLLEQHGIRVFSEKSLQAADEYRCTHVELSR